MLLLLMGLGIGMLVGAVIGAYSFKIYNESKMAELRNSIDIQISQKQTQRDQRLEKQKSFNRIFYQGIDEFILPCQLLIDMTYGIEYLIGIGEQVDGKDVLAPIKGWQTLQYDLESFLYGLQQWTAIKDILIRDCQAKQVDIISELELDKNKAGFFLYTIEKLGIIKKSKAGRYNVFSYVTEHLDLVNLLTGWPSLTESAVRIYFS